MPLSILALFAFILEDLRCLLQAKRHAVPID